MLLHLKPLRIRLGLTQEELAAAVRHHGKHLTTGTISSWERGLTPPKADYLPIVALVLGCEMSELLGRR